MKSFIGTAIISIILFALHGNVFSGENQITEFHEPFGIDLDNSQKMLGNEDVQKANFLVDFSDYSGGSVDEWLKSKGFHFYQGAKNRKLIELSVHEGALIVKAQEPVRGFIFNDSVNLKEFSKVRIEWGINRYPKDASYERKKNNEALSVYVFFGYSKLSSGSFIMPGCRYFISLFLSKDDEINKPYLGRYYHKGGRFVCLGNPKPNEMAISEFDLVRAFRAYFNDEVPVISGISLGIDTSSSGDGGKAAAFIKRIEFLN